MRVKYMDVYLCVCGCEIYRCLFVCVYMRVNCSSPVSEVVEVRRGRTR